ncbi:ribonuclease-like [Emydura macquarii macquarii]|uniref:ribonuclease-like n=1 Tax=Emydura macquarii macquarii TaxID=1129001 RepID=UPI00352B91EE
MAPRGPCPGLFLLLVLLAAGLAQLIPQDSYQKFLREHVDFPKTNATNAHRYCTTLVRRRGLPCNPTHTFIHAHPGQLNSICGSGGACERRQYRCSSTAAYPLTTCLLARSSRPGRCLYRGRAQTRRIRVRCRQWRPVHFEGLL